MINVKQRYYENVYPKAGNRMRIKGILGKIYLMLKRFEYHREDAVYDLSEGSNKYLDIGCGEGNLVFRMLDKTNFAYGMDIAGTRIQKAGNCIKKLKSKDKSRVKFIIGDADEKLPFPENTFDCITMVASLEHFFDPYKALSETARILNKNGKLIVQVPNIAFIQRRLAILFGHLPVTSEDEKGWDGGHLHYFTDSSLEKLLSDSGFLINKVICSGVFACLRSWWVSLLGADIIIRAIKK